MYDGIGLLTEERYNSYDNSLDAITRFGFDLASNRLLKAGDGDIDETTTYTHDANDRQRMIGFVQDVLRHAAEGTGRYQRLDAATRSTARRLQREFLQDPLNVSGNVIGVDLLNENMYLLPWR